MKIGTVIAESNGAKVVRCGFGRSAVVDANGRDVEYFSTDDEAIACLLVVASGIKWNA